MTSASPSSSPSGSDARRFLIIVRAGDKSLHPRWLAGPGPRNWDIVVNYYGDDPALFREPDVVRVDSKGPKWPALHDVIRDHREMIGRYTHVWLPDDDIQTDKASINRLFETCVAYRLEVAQPALTWDSYSTHLVTLQHTNSLIRYTNFVEVMAPCFSAAMLARSLRLFADNPTGWGLDFVWPRLADNPDTGVAIIDTVTVRHTRPIGGPNYRTLREAGISPLVQLRDFCRAHGIDPQIITHKALDRSGRMLVVAGRERRFALRQLTGCVAAVLVAPDRTRVMRRVGKFLPAPLLHRRHGLGQPIADCPNSRVRLTGEGGAEAEALWHDTLSERRGIAASPTFFRFLAVLSPLQRLVDDSGVGRETGILPLGARRSARSCTSGPRPWRAERWDVKRL